MAIVRREILHDTYDTDGELGLPNYVAYATLPLPIAAGGDAGSTAQDAAAQYALSPLTGNCWAELRVSNVPTGEYTGYGLMLWLHADNPLTQGYRLAITSAGWSAYEYGVGDLTTAEHVTQLNDVFRIEHQDGTLRVFINDVEQWSVTGKTVTGGAPIVQSYKQTSGDRTSGRWDTLIIGDWTSENISVDLVNTDNTIVSDRGNDIAGSGFDNLTEVKVNTTVVPHTKDTDVHALFDAVNAITLNAAFGSGSTVEVTDGTNTSSIGVTMVPAAGNTYVVGAAIDNTTGLAQSGGANGDQWHYPLQVASSSLVVQPDTNFVLDTPVPANTTFTYHLYNSGTWDSGTATINKTSELPGTAAFWASSIQPMNLKVGVPAAGTVATHASGTPPLGFTEELGESGGQLAMRTDGTWDGYAINDTPFQTQWKVTNNDNVAGALSNTVTHTPLMPALSSASSKNTTQMGAQITVTTPSVAGVMHWIADPLQTEPTPEQVAAGQNATGNSAELSGADTIQSAGQQPWLTIDGGRPGIRYYYWFVQENT